MPSSVSDPCTSGTWWRCRCARGRRVDRSPLCRRLCVREDSLFDSGMRASVGVLFRGRLAEAGAGTGVDESRADRRGFVSFSPASMLSSSARRFRPGRFRGEGADEDAPDRAVAPSRPSNMAATSSSSSVSSSLSVAPSRTDCSLGVGWADCAAPSRWSSAASLGDACAKSVAVTKSPSCCGLADVTWSGPSSRPPFAAGSTSGMPVCAASSVE